MTHFCILMPCYGLRLKHFLTLLLLNPCSVQILEELGGDASDARLLRGSGTEFVMVRIATREDRSESEDPAPLAKAKIARSVSARRLAVAGEERDRDLA